MKVLVINCGSSSLKYQLFDMTAERVLAKGLVERIGLDGSRATHQLGEQKVVMETPVPSHSKAFAMVVDGLTLGEEAVLDDIHEIAALGHRVTHGGAVFSQATIITEAVKEKIKELIELAPLHNPPNLLGIEAAQQLLPDVPQVAVFDTAFHQSIPASAYLYGLPYEIYQRYGVRKYGFHGTSHQYVARQAAAVLNRRLEELKVITCHLGNGASIAAISKGKSQDTSMGFTPLAGLVMGTRCGDVDPAIVTFLMEKAKLDSAAVNDLMNKQSGVLGLSGVSSDFRDIEEAARQGNERAQLAIDVFVHDVKKYIGAFFAALNGADVLIFTAGLGENSPEIRAAVCSNMQALGIEIDTGKNRVRGAQQDISAAGARVKTLVIPTNEELMIARDTQRLVLDRE